MAAAGAVVHLFPTGQGNVIGNPIEPVIKLTANPRTARSMSEHIDLDVSGLLSLEYGLKEAGDMLMEILDRTVNGRLRPQTRSVTRSMCSQSFIGPRSAHFVVAAFDPRRLETWPDRWRVDRARRR